MHCTRPRTTYRAQGSATGILLASGRSGFGDSTLSHRVRVNAEIIRSVIVSANGALLISGSVHVKGRTIRLIGSHVACEDNGKELSRSTRNVADGISP